MATLTVRQLAEIAVHEVGAQPGTPIEVRELANMAGEHLVAMHQWNWLLGREVRLRPRATIALAGATWTEATRTLALTGAFEDYDFLSADSIDIEEGTGATPGRYEVESRTSDDAIVLATSIGAAADGQTDIGGEMRNDQIALPSDFDLQAIVGYSMTNGLTGTLEMTTPQGMLDLRSWPGLATVTSFWGLVSYVRSSAGGVPLQRLELWPSTSSTEEELVLFYRGGWIAPASDTDALAIPNWLNALYIEVFKAFVMGSEEPEGGTVDQRVTALRGGALYADAIRRDAQVMADLGPLANTWVEGPPQQVSRFSMYRSPTVS